MNTHLDIIGSFIIAGALILGFAQFNANKHSAMLEATTSVMNQDAMSSFTTVMISDLRKIGYGCQNEAFLTIQQKRLVFLSDIDNNGSIDTVKYWFATPAESTLNPSDSLLYRQVNNEDAVGSSLGIVDLRFRYFNAAGSETTSQIAVKSVGVNARIQSTIPVNNMYTENTASFRITPRNNK